MQAIIARFVREDDGQDLIEYALLATLIALVAGAGATTLGTNLEHLVHGHGGQGVGLGGESGVERHHSRGPARDARAARVYIRCENHGQAFRQPHGIDRDSRRAQHGKPCGCSAGSRSRRTDRT